MMLDLGRYCCWMGQWAMRWVKSQWLRRFQSMWLWLKRGCSRCWTGLQSMGWFSCWSICRWGILLQQGHSRMAGTRSRCRVRSLVRIVLSNPMRGKTQSRIRTVERCSLLLSHFQHLGQNKFRNQHPNQVQGWWRNQSWHLQQYIVEFRWTHCRFFMLCR